jgi:predicted metal-dependent phosphoesterase TrpH
MREDGPRGTRVDLHVHSYASGLATNPWVKGLGPEGVGVRESYTPVENAYGMAKGAGMDLVTLTDHETISGAQELAYRRDFFVGEEIAAVFPEDGSQVDVLVFGLDEEGHREAQARRPDVYALVDYLREAGLAHVLAHPVYGMPTDLDRTMVEKRILLFGLWEFVNGSRPARQNRLAREVAGGVGPAVLRQLAARHGMPAPPHRRIAGTAGSDDHGCLYIGETYTVGPAGIEDPGEFLEALKAGEVRPGGEDGSAARVAHSGIRIAGRALEEANGRSGAGGGAVVAVGRMLAGALPRELSGAVGRAIGRRASAGAGSEGEGLLPYLPLLAGLDMAGMRGALVSRYEERLGDALGGAGSGLPLVDLLTSVGDLADAHLPIAPYAGVHGYFGRENRKARLLEREVFPDRRGAPKVGLFVDELDDALGGTHRELALHATGTKDASVRLVRCGAGGGGREDHRLRALGALPVPLGEGAVLGVSSLLDVLDYVVEEEYTSLHAAVPGPLGLAALVAGLVLGIPVAATYRPELLAYARSLSGDAMVGEVVEAVARAFYGRCAALCVTGAEDALALRELGYRAVIEVLGEGCGSETLEGFLAMHARVAGMEAPATPVPVASTPVG